jgi:hypothetical protein
MSKAYPTSLHDVGNGRLPLDCAGGAATRTN